MKKRLLFGFLLITAILFSGQTTSRTIGPGSFYYNYVDEKMPVSIHILEFDLTDPNLEVITQKANSQIAARAKTSVMAHQLEIEGKNVVAAINADFFHKDGTPVGVQVADGVLLKKPFIRSAFGLLNNNRPFIEILDFEGLLLAGDKQCEIDDVNAHRGENEMILFNNYRGVTSNTNNWGIEVAAQYLSEPCINDTSYIVVISKDSYYRSEGNKDIPGYGVILSGHGEKSRFLKNNVNIGDTLKILLKLPPVKKEIVEAVGGAPKIIQKGRIDIDIRKEKLPLNFSTDRHPRTAVGYNRNKTKLYMFVVDGRQPEYSVGMSLRELARFMIDWGVYEGINLDGGGSSTMVVRNSVVNKPSDATGERSVSNALMVLCKNQSDEVEFMNITPGRLKLPKNENYKFELHLFDQYYNSISYEKANWFCADDLGTINDSGEFSAGGHSTSGYIFVDVDGKKDSSYVIIK